MGGSSSRRAAPILYRGTTLGPNALTQIRRVMGTNPNLSLEEMASRVCRAFGWRRPNGEMPIRSCSELLKRLDARALIELPPRRRQKKSESAEGSSRERPPCSPSSLGAGAEDSLGPPPPGTAPVSVRLILSWERGSFRSLLAERHYLGYRQPIGEGLCYVAFFSGRPAALLSWASPTLHNPLRDRFIGWDAALRKRRLHLVTTNIRFLMLPDRSEPNLASRILSENLRCLSRDSERLYGHRLLLAETFVDPSRFRGTCYRASNWIYLGRTSGWSKSGWTYRHHGQPKDLFVFELDRRARLRLSDPKSSVDRTEQQHGGGIMLCAEKLPLEGKGSLFEVLGTIRDIRKPRGLRHPMQGVLALSVAAVLCGARSLVAIAQWVEDLPLETRKKLGDRGRRGPSEPTFRRVLKSVDVEEIDRKLGEWITQRVDLFGKAVAIDGKTIRGSRDGETAAPVHLLSAVLHRDAVVLSQARVPDKENEITGAKPLVAGLDLEGATVTADAMHTQREFARYLVEEKKADYLFTVKENQPTLKSDIETLGLESFPPSAPADEQGARSDREATDLDK